MCMLGDPYVARNIPRSKAIKVHKRVFQRRGRPITFCATAYSDVTFENRTTRKRVSVYRLRHVHRTVRPARSKDPYNSEGNGRGFWCYTPGREIGSIGDTTLEGYVWGRVVFHAMGFRAEYFRPTRRIG